MNIDIECVGCIVNQSARVANAVKADEKLREKLRLHVERLSKDFSFDENPPEIASYVYEDMAKIANKTDLYDEVKKISTEKAISFKPFLKEQLENSNDKLLTATKIAVAGNVIDLAAAVEFDLTEELEKIFDRDFSYNDVEKLRERLSTCKSVLVLGDNVGEHIFDYIYIQTLQDLYPDIKFTYVVRGNPIINDVTIKEAKEAGFDKLCNLVDSGVNTPGFEYARSTKESQELFDSSDLIISKGMGNYECLTPPAREGICFLLKVKCGVVGRSLGKEIGDIICKVV
ncbi:ARMT1-like domain-containing protein [Sulfurimonas sp.]|nr:ARMT1-like domain-containing protein [Sulfurimonas sp.]